MNNQSIDIPKTESLSGVSESELFKLLEDVRPEDFKESWFTYKDSNSIGNVKRIFQGFNSTKYEGSDFETLEKLTKFDYVFYFEKYNIYIRITQISDSEGCYNNQYFEKVVPIERTLIVYEANGSESKIECKVRDEDNDREYSDHENDDQEYSDHEDEGRKYAEDDDGIPF